MLGNLFLLLYICTFFHPSSLFVSFLMPCFNFWLAEEARLLDLMVFVRPFQLNYHLLSYSEEKWKWPYSHFGGKGESFYPK